jgi:hypothetical protein
MPFRYFDDPYIYGPLTQEEFDTIPVNHRATFVNGQIYVGVAVELEQFADRIIDRPVIVEQVEPPTEE